MALSEYQRGLVLNEKEQCLRQIEAYSTLLSGFFVGPYIRKKVKEKVNKLLYKVDVLDIMLSKDNPLNII
jgi:hypothetical protein